MGALSIGVEYNVAAQRVIWVGNLPTAMVSAAWRRASSSNPKERKAGKSLPDLGNCRERILV